MDDLKSFDEIFKPDPRNEGWVTWDETTGAYRKLTLADQYAAIEQLTLHGDVPEAVRTQFDVCRSLWLYSWFVYRFATVAELQAYATIEFALKVKISTIDPMVGEGKPPAATAVCHQPRFAARQRLSRASGDVRTPRRK